MEHISCSQEVIAVNSMAWWQIEQKESILRRGFRKMKMIQSGFHIQWTFNKPVGNCVYFKIPNDMIFDPYENKNCIYNGLINLESHKEGWESTVDVWCKDVDKLHLQCRYQSFIGRCKSYHPKLTTCGIVPLHSKYDMLTIPIRNNEHFNTVIYGTLVFIIGVSLYLAQLLHNGN